MRLAADDDERTPPIGLYNMQRSSENPLYLKVNLSIRAMGKLNFQLVNSNGKLSEGHPTKKCLRKKSQFRLD